MEGNAKDLTEGSMRSRAFEFESSANKALFILLLKQARHEAIFTVNISKHKYGEGVHLVLCLMNTIFGSVKEPRVFPQSFACPTDIRWTCQGISFLLSSASTYHNGWNSFQKVTLWEELPPSFLTIVYRKFTAFFCGTCTPCQLSMCFS